MTILPTITNSSTGFFKLQPGQISECGGFGSCPKTGDRYERIDQPSFDGTGNSFLDGKLTEFSDTSKLDSVVSDTIDEIEKALGPADAIEYLIKQASKEIKSGSDLRKKLDQLAKAANIDSAYFEGARSEEIINLMKPLAEKIQGQT